MATVLILEDNSEIAWLYERIFEQHRTCVMSDVPDAIQYLEGVRPDLVITDFHLPSGSGLDVINYMRATPQLRDVPVLGISVDDMLKENATEQGMNAFLTKPVDISELINTAQKLISETPTRVPSATLRAALTRYGEAYKKVYNRLPKGIWTGTQALIDGQPCDETWLRSEIRRLDSLTKNGVPKNYLMRLLDKIRMM